MTLSCSRKLFAALFFLCVILLAVGFYVEYADGVIPCPLCVLQRFAYGLVALVAFIAMCHRFKGVGRRVYGFFGVLFSSTGLALAIRQVWLQSLPPNNEAACVPGLTYLFKMFPFTKAMSIVLKGTADCSLVHWQLWGLPMSKWSALSFAFLGLVMLWQLFGPNKDKR